MSHPFHKFSNNASGSPARLPNSTWEKLKKYAHPVWEIGDVGDDLVGYRKREETAEVDYESDAHPLINPGDVIVLLMGGRQLEARVLTQWDDGTYSIASEAGYLDNVHGSWMEKRAQAQPLSPPDESHEMDRENTPTVPPGNQTVDQLKKLMESRNGHVAIKISPSSVLELRMNENGGVEALLWHQSTSLAHSGEYTSLEQVVQDLGLKEWYSETAPPSQSIR